MPNLAKDELAEYDETPRITQFRKGVVALIGFLAVCVAIALWHSPDGGTTSSSSKNHLRIPRLLFENSHPQEASDDPTPQTYSVAIVGGRPLTLDFYAAKTSGAVPAPLIIFIHAGGWREGSSRNLPALPLLKHGFAIASLNYRLTRDVGQWGNESVFWPAQAHDVKAAVRWLRANADSLNINPNAFVSFGESAGGHLSAILATTNGVEFLEGTLGNYTSVSSSVQLSVDWYGPSSFLNLDKDKEAVGPPQYPTDLQHEGLDAPESELFGSIRTNITLTQIIEHARVTSAPWQPLAHLAQAASPVWYAAGNGGAKPPVPILIHHGDDDSNVPLTQSYRLRDALVGRGQDVNMVTVPKGQHGAIPGAYWPTDLLLEVINGWVHEHLRQLGIMLPDALTAV